MHSQHKELTEILKTSSSRNHRSWERGTTDEPGATKLSEAQETLSQIWVLQHGRTLRGIYSLPPLHEVGSAIE